MLRVKPTAIDRLIGVFSPSAMVGRMQARATADLMTGDSPAYSTSSGASRAMRNWRVSSGDPDSELWESENLRYRARDLYRNTPLARAAIRTTLTNVVGSGLRLNASIDRDFIGLTDEQAEAWERAAEREFSMWAGSQFADATLTGTFYDLQALAFLTALCSGDCFALLPWVRRKGSAYDLRVQLVEADRVCNPNLRPDDETIAAGIEVDGYGAPVRYHFCSPHPGTTLSSKAFKWRAVSAFGASSGRRNVLHLFDRERPDQRRGTPYLAPVMECLKQLGRYTDAELMAAVVSGMFTVFVRTETGEGFENGFDPLTGENPVPVAPNEYALGAGAVVGLGPNEKIETANPGRPNTGFDPFVTAITRQIGAALEIPFELLNKHFSASYSASRAALLEAWKFFRRRREWLISSFCEPVYAEWMTEAVVKGRVSAPGFLEDPAVRHAYLGAEWVGPTMGQIDPDKEVTAAVKRIDACLSTRSREAAELTGGDYERIVRRRGREETMRTEYGVNTPVPGAQAPAAPGENPDRGDDERTREE